MIKFQGRSPYDATHWIGPEGYLCPSDVKYAMPKRARNVNGEWRVVVNDVHYYTQTARMETCLTPGKLTKTKCASSASEKSPSCKGPFDLFLVLCLELERKSFFKKSGNVSQIRPVGYWRRAISRSAPRNSSTTGCWPTTHVTHTRESSLTSSNSPQPAHAIYQPRIFNYLASMNKVVTVIVLTITSLGV